MSDRPIHPIQKMVDALGKVAQDTRSRYHLTLGQLIEQLAEFPPQAPVTFDFNGIPPDVLDSYRGYYSDLALDYDERHSKTVKVLLEQCQSALGATFEGYKGGDYMMGEDTPLWVSHYSQSSGRAILGLSTLDDRVVILTKVVD